MSISLTDDDPVAEVELVELAGEGGEEASEGHHQSAHDRRQPGGLPPADAHRQRGEQQRDRRRQGPEKT